MKPTRLWALAALPLALAACGGDEAVEEGTDTAVAVPTTETGAVAAPAPGDTGMAGATSAGHTVSMNPAGNSGVSGQAQLMEHGQGQTMVMVNLTGQGNSTHSGHIHSGTCDALGPVVAPLQDVTLTNGTGSSSSTVQVPLATVMNGQHIVAYHTTSGDNAGAPAVCGQIPAGGSTGQAM
ncbi:MAG: hypothetical protein KY467_12790 [Gemmatimonadetes bacterium]|nr:hypothetical protein [Gemmatimonadota bacterium]